MELKSNQKSSNMSTDKRMKHCVDFSYIDFYNVVFTEDLVFDEQP